MAERTMLVTLRVTVGDLSEETRKECADDMEESPEGLPTVADHSLNDFAHIIKDVLSGGEDNGFHADMFAGTDVYGTFVDCEIVSAEWQTTTAQEG